MAKTKTTAQESEKLEEKAAKSSKSAKVKAQAVEVSEEKPPKKKKSTPATEPVAGEVIVNEPSKEPAEKKAAPKKKKSAPAAEPAVATAVEPPVIETPKEEVAKAATPKKKKAAPAEKVEEVHIEEEKAEPAKTKKTAKKKKEEPQPAPEAAPEPAPVSEELPAAASEPASAGPEPPAPEQAAPAGVAAETPAAQAPVPTLPSVRYSDEDLAEFAQIIINEREGALDELRMLRERLEDLNSIDSAEESMIYSMHMAEQGSEAIEKEKTYAQIQRINEYIKKLDDALARIKDKTYGICRVCNILIAKERLKAVPITTLSASYKIHQKCPEDGIDRIEPVR